MMAYPETVVASSVYGEDEQPSSAVAGEEASAEELAAHASGVDGSYTSGMQDGMLRPNKHTSAAMAAAHRSQAIVPNDWFFGSKAPEEEAEVPLGPAMPEGNN